MPPALYPQVLTGVFTLLAAFGAIVLKHFLDKSKRKDAVRYALFTEVASIIGIIEKRNYREMIRLRAEGDVDTLTAVIPNSYRVVYDSLIGDIGLLNREDVIGLISFYMSIMAVVEDIKPGGTFSRLESATPEAYQEALQILDDALSTGRGLLGIDPEK
ncbi:hypothetical protein [Salinicola acroporae]|uniref:DUF4760 domain-containing protein n=1 Tax=Salinicola acroporae TaxID=1541440 RepID=A0ABT6I461_9GAMM|nr:hypothetical protein [Salinicola acroporae]MDH4572477.1 hypothetical protein [Salinicola acroporae]